MHRTLAGNNMLKSSISSARMRHSLLRGTAYAALGLCIIILGGVFLPPEDLQIIGFPLYIVGGGLITYGLLPYRKLTLLEKNPSTLTIDRGYLTWRRHNKPLVSIPAQDIKSFSYNSDPLHYGIHISLTTGRYIFMPYFSKHTYDRLVQEYPCRT